jgi:DNA-binding CsgD family transcriptional regulator
VAFWTHDDLLVVVLRAEEANAFSRREVARGQFLVPHLARSLSIARQLERRSAHNVSLLPEGETRLPFTEGPPPTVSQSFSFTPRESELAWALARGLGTRLAARDLGMAFHTARTHLKTIFRKAAVTSQRDLVRVVLGAAWERPVHLNQERPEDK